MQNMDSRSKQKWFRPLFAILLVLQFSLPALSFNSHTVPDGTPVFAGQGFVVDCSTGLKIQTAFQGKIGQGPHYFFQAGSGEKRTLQTVLSSFRFMTFNVLNLLESPGKYETVDGKRVFQYNRIVKPEWQTRGVFETIKRSNPDIFALEEVENLDALNQSTKKYLNDEYFNILV